MGSKYPYPNTDEGWVKLGEYIVTNGVDIDPEKVGELVSEATETIFTHYTHEERSVALKKRATARNCLMDLAELKAHEAVRGYGERKTEEERKEAHEALYGTRDIPERQYRSRREEGAIRYVFGPEAYKEEWGWGRGKGFCWSITDYGLGEIAESAQKYTSIERAKQGAEATVERSRKCSTGPFLVQIFDEPPSLDPSREKTTRRAVFQKTW